MPQSKVTEKNGGVPVAQNELLKIARRLQSADAQEALARVYVCATLFHGPQSHEVAEAGAGEAAAAAAMERLAMGRSADVVGDLAVAEKWGYWHAKKAAAAARMEADVSVVVQSLMAQLSFSTTPRPHTGAEAVDDAVGDAEDDAEACVQTSSNAAASMAATAAKTSALSNGHVSFEESLKNEMAAKSVSDELIKTNTQFLNGEPVELHKNIVSGTGNSDDHSIMSRQREANGRTNTAVRALAEDVGEDDDAPAAENASTRMPSPRNTGLNVHVDQDDDVEAAAPLLSCEASSEESPTADTTLSSLAFPQLTSPAVSVKDINPLGEGAKTTTRTHPLKRLCFEDYNLHFTQADFDAACEELQRLPHSDAAASAAQKGKAGQPTALLNIAMPKLMAERVLPPPPRQFEDSGLHYVRRQLSVRQLQPFVCPLKALTLRLAEGDAAFASPSASSAHAAENSRAPHFTDPLMIRLLAELEEVCVRHPVPRVRVRPDAQVYCRDRGYFKADEVRVQLHVEVIPVSGPMAGEGVRVLVRVPAGYPFVAPRAHLTVELPHHRCTGVAMDKVPHLIALSYETAVPNACGVCSAPVHAEEVEQLQPLHGPINSNWRPSLTLRHVLTALADLFNADEFAETAKELQNDRLMRSGLHRARVNMFEEENNSAQEVAAAASAGTAGTTATGAALRRSGNDEEDAAGADSADVTTSVENEEAPSYLLLCNGPFLVRSAAPTAAPSSPTSVIISAEPSAERTGEMDGGDDNASTCTACSTPTSRYNNNNNSGSAHRRRQRKQLLYNEMESDRLSGPWRGCWGHVLYSAATTATTAGASTSVSSPIRIGGSNSNISSYHGSPVVNGAATGPRGEASVKSPCTLYSRQAAPLSPTFAPAPPSPPPLPAHRERNGSLFIRLKHHVPTAPAAVIRLVHVPSHVLREPHNASAVNTPQRRSRGRLLPQSSWVTAALGPRDTAAPPGTVWTSSSSLSEMETELLICVHDDDDDEKRVDAPGDLATTTASRGCQWQHVNLHELREVSVVVSSTGNTGNIGVPQGSLATVETNSTNVSESVLRAGEEGTTERCYAVVVDVPADQAVSLVFSSDEAACLAVPWHTAAATDAEEKSDKNTGAVAAAAHWDDVCDCNHDAIRGVLVELPYDEWQFKATSATAALANEARCDADIHPHWPRNARFHGGQRVIPLTLCEASFRAYQLLQSTQIAKHSSNAHACSYLAAAPHTRVRQAYAATRNARDQGTIMRRYGFWGWRNVLLPVFSAETVELVQSALQANNGSSDDATAAAPHKSTSVTSVKMLATALRVWEVSAVQDFCVACVQLHRDPDASLVYRVPFRSFAVLRTLTLTAAYALEVMQTLKNNNDSNEGGTSTSAAEGAALHECLLNVLWNATVLAVVTAAVKPAFLEMCVALVDYVKEKGDTAADADLNRATTTTEANLDRCRREVQLALMQLTPLQRSAAQVLAASTMSAFPKEVAALVTDTAAPVADGAAEKSAMTSLVEQVTQLLNAPSMPPFTNVMLDDHAAASRVSAFTRLIMSS